MDSLQEYKTGERCQFCGSPIEQGHIPGCSATPTNADSRLRREEFKIGEALSEEDRTEFFNLYCKAHEVPLNIAKKTLSHFLEEFQQPQAAKHLYVARYEGRVVGGAEIEISGDQGSREAYLSRKVVDEKYRGQGIAPRLVKLRLTKAKEEGCREAWSLVEPDNDLALRTIFKDNFVIRGRAADKMGEVEGSLKRMYYVSKDLRVEDTQTVKQIDLKEVPEASQEADLVGNRVLINWDRKDLIDAALRQGYMGKQILFPAERDNAVKYNTLLFEK